MSGMELFYTWLVAFFTLAIFSFLYKDNPFYRFAEHIFAGLSAGYYVGLIWESVIIQQLWDPITKNGAWYLIIPGLLGCLTFGRLFARVWPQGAWLPRVALAFVMGNTAGVFLVSELHGKVLPQMQSTMTPQPAGGPTDYILTAIIIVGVISTLIYFYFSHEHKGLLGATATVGVWMIMIAFGAHFGYTVMGRVSLLIGRVQFLVDDWIGSFSQLF